MSSSEKVELSQQSLWAKWEHPQDPGRCRRLSMGGEAAGGHLSLQNFWLQIRIWLEDLTPHGWSGLGRAP